MRGLTLARPAIAPGDWTAEAWAAMDRRLAAHAAAPLAVAYSGGGDSLALLLLAQGWARRHGRRLIALTVDHRLQAASAAWARTCADEAAGLGVAHRVLTWDGPKPTAGLPAAARDARHRLLARAAREVGARVLLMGHTADDRAEAAVLRAEGLRVGDPREWAPAPVWPDGRGVFLLRPLLRARRGDLRAWLRGQGRGWIDDPANEDMASPRARARRQAPAPPPEPAPLGPAPAVFAEPGALAFDRRALAQDRRALAAAIACSAGSDGPPRGERLDRLIEALGGEAPCSATLGGARLVAEDGGVILAREPGRSPPPTLRLEPGLETVWDGRYAVRAAVSGLALTPLAGRAARLAPAQKAALRAVPAIARGALPAVIGPCGEVTCPILAEDSRLEIASLMVDRYRAAMGEVSREPGA